MAGTWTLTDVETRTWRESFEVAGEARGGAAAWSIKKRVLRGGLADGVDLVEVDGGELSFSVIPTRGMGVWRGAYRGTLLGWDSPVRGPVHPKFVNLADRGGLGWLEGFDELLARCGLESNGAPCADVVPSNTGARVETRLPLHGRIANRPAHRVTVEVGEGDAPELAVTGVVEESALFCPGLRLETRISTRAGSNALTVEDTVTNLRAVESEMQMLYHWNLGAPLLGAGARLVAPARTVIPRDARAAGGAGTYDTYLGPTPGFAEEVFFYDLAADADGRTLAMLRDAEGGRAVALRFSRAELPYFTQWKNTTPDGYVTGLEPATNCPNAKPFEREEGRVVRLAPGGAWRASVSFEVLEGPDAVRAIEDEAAAVAGGAAPTVHDSPQPGYSPAAREPRRA